MSLDRQKTTLLFTKHVKQYIEKSQLALEMNLTSIHEDAASIPVRFISAEL